MFAYALGREYEVSRGDLERLYMAGFLHGLHHRLGAVYTKRPATRAAAGHKVFLLADGHFRTDS